MQLRIVFVLLSLAIVSFSTEAVARMRGGSQISNKTNLVSVTAAAECTYKPPLGCLLTEDNLDYYRSKNWMNIRLEIRWALWQSDVGEELISNTVSYVNNLLSYAADNNQTLVLSNFSFGEGPKYSDHAGLLGADDGFSTEQFADFWLKMATQFHGSPGLNGYELMNEPHSSVHGSIASCVGNSVAAQDWFNAYQAAINSIRSVDMDSTIYIDGFHYSSAYRWALSGYSGDYYTLVDPANKLVFTAHAYPDRDSSGTHYDWDTEVAAGDIESMVSCVSQSPLNLGSDILVRRVTPFVEWCHQHNVRCLIGESAVGPQENSENWMTTLDNLLTYLSENNIPVMYHAVGTQWADTYSYSVEKWKTSPFVGMDKTQTAVLSKFSNAAKTNSIFLTGPTTAEASVESSDFTVRYNGYIEEKFIITPSDGGNGGVFSPLNVTCNVGFNCAKTFTYTQDVIGTYTIQATTSGIESNSIELSVE